MLNSILRLPEVKSHTGLSRSTIYLRIKEGTFPPPISLGARAVGWPSNEIDALNRARISGVTEDELRCLIEILVSGRDTLSLDEDHRDKR